MLHRGMHRACQVRAQRKGGRTGRAARRVGCGKGGGEAGCGRRGPARPGRGAVMLTGLYWRLPPARRSA